MNICIHISFFYHWPLIDENVPGADGVMRLSRALVEFFLKSSQKLKELKDIQTALPNVYTRKAVGVLTGCDYAMVVHTSHGETPALFAASRMLRRLLFRLQPIPMKPIF